jgi:hypothetical protein
MKVSCLSPGVVKRHSRIALVMLLALLTLIGAPQAQGQGSTDLLEGIPVVGTISPEAPATIYTLSGTPGALLIVQAVGISDGMQPELSLLSTTQQPLSEGKSDPFGLGNDARLTFVVKESGPHFVLVAGTPGSFVIRYSTIPQDVVTPLVAGAPVTEDFVSGSPGVYSFVADAVQASNLTVTSPSGLSLPFVVHVYTAEGQPVGALINQGISPAALLIPSGFNNYIVVVSALGDELSGPITITLTHGAATSAPLGILSATPISGGGSATQCLATGVRTDIAVNLRSGPDTSFPVAGSIPAGGAFTVIARDPTGAWYGGRLPSGQVAWVFSGVVSLTGPCQQLQVFATYAPSATYTATATGTPTLTLTPTATTTAATATPTVTATQQGAPPDTDLNDPLNIALDSSASVTEYVSYPDGDTDDRVQYEVTGMSTDPATSDGRAHLVIQATCSGTGTDQIRFYVGGLLYGCGQPIVDQEVTYETRYGLVVITAVGGEGTYVQWTLTGTATRIQ